VLAASAPIACAAEAVHYTKESLQEFEKQLAAGQIRSATFNKKIRTIRLTLKSGEHGLVSYPRRGAPAAEAKLKAKGVSVTVLAPALANKELREKPKKHKLRYIAGGVLVVVIVIVGGVLLVRRRSERE
jgi:ATP-dependent Zn protease